MTRIPEEMRALERMLSATYFCNFSIFQSLHDAWVTAAKQLVVGQVGIDMLAVLT